MVRSRRALVVAHSANARDSVLWRYALAHDDRFDLIVPTASESDDTAWVAPWLGTGRVLQLEEIRLSKTSHTSLIYRGLWSILSSGNYAFAHIATEPWSLLAQTSNLRLPVVVHGAETILKAAPLRYRVRRVGGGRVLRSAVGVSAWGSEALREFERLGVSKSVPKAVIPMGIPNPSMFSRAPLRSLDYTVRLLYVGRLVPEKGITDLLEAIMRDPNLPVSVRIAGTGPCETAVIQAVRKDKRLTYLGAIDATGVAEQLRECDLCVLPSRITPQWTEQWGRVAVEALLVGRPIITSNSGELALINPSPDLVFNADDVRDLHRVLKVVASSDHHTLEQWAEVAAARSLAFTPERVYSTLQQFWDEVFVHIASR